MNIERKDNGDIFATDGVGTVYSKVNGRFYRTTTDGKKTRIGEAVFEETLKDIEQGMEEELAKLVAETEESNNTEAGKKIELDMAMEEMGYYPIDSEWNDIRYSTCDGQSKVMAWNTVEEGMKWVEEQKLGTRMLENYCRHPEGTDLQKPAVLNQYGCVDCSKCNVQNCVHRDCMRRNPTSESGLAECPRLKVKAEEPKQPKAKKGRKSKDIAHEAEGVTLTAKQVDFIKHLPDTCFWENGLDSRIWVDCLCDEIGGQFEGKPMTVGAMISTLCEKGLGSRGSERRDGRKCTSFELTARGKAVAKSLGLH